jgi:imidazolonepropionase-like amidohydrolase
MLNVFISALALALPGETTQPLPPATPEKVGEEVGEAKGGEPDLAAQQVTAFKASRIHIGDGRTLEDGVLIITDGVITSVGKNLEVPESATVVEHDGAISPGLIALHSYEGAGAELYDSTRITLPSADASHAFQPKDHDFYRASRAGITSLVLAPSTQSLVGGQSAIVKTRGGTIVKKGAQLTLGLSSAALHSNKFPTSYDGAMRELDRLFADPEGAIGRAASGNLPVLMSVDDRSETLRALAFAKRYSLKGALYGSYWAEEIAAEIKQSGLGVVCDPFDVGDPSRGVRSVKALSEAGVPFGFGLDAPQRDPESLRFGAAVCIRGGLDPHVARRALTGDAAKIAGVEGRIGRLARGLDADIVLWSGDPIQLTSSVEAVYIDGVQVVGGKR